MKSKNVLRFLLVTLFYIILSQLTAVASALPLPLTDGFDYSFTPLTQHATDFQLTEGTVSGVQIRTQVFSNGSSYLYVYQINNNSPEIFNLFTLSLMPGASAIYEAGYDVDGLLSNFDSAGNIPTLAYCDSTTMSFDLLLMPDGSFNPWDWSSVVYIKSDFAPGQVTGTVQGLGGYASGEVVGPVPEPATVAVDIKPGSCPNPLNIKSKGVLPVAVLGAEDFDVNNIDVLSVRLAGIAAIRSNYRDVTTPLADANECECSTERSDGYTDLILKFDTQAIVAAIGDVNDSDEWILELTGVLYDDTPIVGEDCVIIRAKSNSKKK